MSCARRAWPGSTRHWRRSRTTHGDPHAPPALHHGHRSHGCARAAQCRPVRRYRVPPSERRARLVRAPSPLHPGARGRDGGERGAEHRPPGRCSTSAPTRRPPSSSNHQGSSWTCGVRVRWRAIRPWWGTTLVPTPSSRTVSSSSEAARRRNRGSAGAARWTALGVGLPLLQPALESEIVLARHARTALAQHLAGPARRRRPADRWPSRPAPWPAPRRRGSDRRSRSRPRGRCPGPRPCTGGGRA